MKRTIPHSHPAELIRLCECVISSFDARKVTPATHIENLSKEGDLKSTFQNEDMVAFISDVFYGIQRYKQMLKLIVDGLYVQHKGNILRSDRSMYTIMAFICVQRLNDFEWSELRRCVLDLPPHQMHMLFAFLFGSSGKRQQISEADVADDPDQKESEKDKMGNLAEKEQEFDTKQRQWLTEQLSLVYDYVYVEKELLGSLDRFQPEVQTLLQELRDKFQVYDGSQALSDKTLGATKPDTLQKISKVTEPKPFNLTRPRPRVLPPPPVAISLIPKSNPVPAIIHKMTLEHIELQNEQRRKKIKAAVLQRHTKAKPPKLRSILRPSKLKKIIQEVEAERASHFVQYKAKPPPVHEEPLEPIKLTAASVYREDALFRKKQENEAAIIRAFEFELKDSSEFESWKAEMLQKDYEERVQIIEARRQEMAKAQAEALAAMEKKREENHTLVEQLKQISLEWRKRREQEEKEALKAAKEKAENIAAQKENVKTAVESVAVMKKKSAEEMVKQKQEWAEVRRREQEETLRKRRELIYQIQAMEAKSNALAKKPKEVDPTSTSGTGLLDEMSLLELHERLAMLKLKYEEERVRKRQLILIDKQERQHVLLAKAKNLSRLRNLASNEGDRRRILSKAQREEEKEYRAKQMEEATMAVFERIEIHRVTRREQALQLAQDIKQRKQEQLKLQEGHEQVEATRWSSLLQGAEREAKQRQAFAQNQAIVYETTQAKERAQQKLNIQRKEQAEEEFLTQYQTRLNNTLEEVRQFESKEANLKRQQVTLMKSRQQDATEFLRTLNPYATKMNETTLSRAKTISSRSLSAQRARPQVSDETLERRPSTSEGNTIGLPVSQNFVSEQLKVA